MTGMTDQPDNAFVNVAPAKPVQPPAGDLPAPTALSEHDAIRAVAMLIEDLISDDQFQAISGIDAIEVPELLADPVRTAQVERARLAMQNSGALARLEAARHAREAVAIAAQIMRDSEMHASTRLNAATFIAKVSGTERPAAEHSNSNSAFVVRILLGDDKPPIVIGGAPRES